MTSVTEPAAITLTGTITWEIEATSRPFDRRGAQKEPRAKRDARWGAARACRLELWDVVLSSSRMLARGQETNVEEVSQIKSRRVVLTSKGIGTADCVKKNGVKL